MFGFFSGFILDLTEENPCALSNLGLNQSLLVVKARLKPGYN